MYTPFVRVVVLAVCSLMMLTWAAPVAAQGGVVHAVLFYSPACPHCHDVMEEDLPPLLAQYGEQLDIVGIDVSGPGGQSLYQAAIEEFAIPDQRIGVPTMIVNDVVLVGAQEIPQELPGLVDTYLAQGGTDWPGVPGLAAALNVPDPAGAADPAANTPDDTAAVASTGEGSGPPEPATNNALAVETTPPFMRDLAGNTLAVIVLVGMLGVTVYTALTFGRAPAAAPPTWQAWAIPLLSVLGLGIAAYLTMVETGQTAAVCGPVGQCDVVQQSPYARLFGVIPVALLGVLGYVAILAAWGVARFGSDRLADWARVALFALAAIGTLASLVLTFLEPFVIGATCMWCLSSSVVMVALLWLTRDDSKQALAHLRA